jgi:hypothetical protein
MITPKGDETVAISVLLALLYNSGIDLLRQIAQWGITRRRFSNCPAN